MKTNRIDFIFSFQIFVWYLLFIFKYTKYSPKLALIIALFHNTLVLILMIYYKVNLFQIIFFCFLNLFIKIIPLWTLRNNKSYDIKATLTLVIIYMIWLYINNTNVIIVYNKQINNIKNNKPVGPVTEFINKLFK